MTQQVKKKHILPITMIFALFAMIAFVTGLQNPMGVIIKNQFETTNFLSQLGTAANFIAYAFMGIPSGMLLQKIGYKKTALSAIAIGFIGVSIIFISGQTNSFGIYLAGAFISGFSMCMLNTVVNPLLNTLGGEGKRGNQLLQFAGTISSVSATLIPVLVGYLIGNITSATIGKANPVLFIAMGIFVLTFLVLYFVSIPEPHNITKVQKKKALHSPLSFRHFILGIIAIFVYVGVENGIPNLANLFMTSELNIDTTIAGTIIGTYWFLMFIGRFIGAALGGYFSSKSMLAFASIVATLFVLLAIFFPLGITVKMPILESDISFGLAKVPISIMFLTLCGLCTSVMWGSIFNLAVEGLGKYTTTASGIFMVMVCGGGILPLIQAHVADSWGYINSYWVIVIGIVYMAFYALAGYKNINKNIPVK